ncbi:glycosyltransferase family 2 protein [Niveibacterium sp. COAC-50]|uniref:glycosyltransferase family 2 protein n=1 Tax=Niveibacterium sp. COAC-50 TaxID=2729384 RepID=UPI001551AC26|nr:glycosyltransferase [Niveibacterium sp. COAC-50]
MTASFKRSDLTIAIPTTGRDTKLLCRIVGLTLEEQAHVIVVWDGPTAPTNRLVSTLANQGVQFITHDRNRGPSAARNTAASLISTPLGMYLDDDIVPAQGFVETVIAFHNQHPDILTMMIGSVTWRGGPYASALTEWFETRGNWNVFHCVPGGKPHSSFMTGFTSFKTAAMSSIRLDEGFTRYGCEDTEFGYRFFSRGGQLISWPELTGVHHKRLEPSDYIRDHINAGYSKGILITRHPDATFSLPWLIKSINTTAQRDALDSLCIAADQLTHIGGGRACIELDIAMRLITEQAIQIGFVEYLCDNFPGARALRDRAIAGEYIDEQTIVFGIEDFAPLLFERARRCTNSSTRAALLARCQALIPHFTAPLLDAYETKRDDSALVALRKHLDTHHELLDSRTIKKLRIHLGLDTTPAPNRGTRDLYANLRSAEDEHDVESVIEFAQSILEIDPSHTGALISWARATINTDKRFARILLAQAQHHAGFRPLHEQETRLPEIAAMQATIIRREDHEVS